MAIYQGLFQQLVASASVQAAFGTSISSKNAVFFGAASKDPPARFIVINRVDAPPAGQTMDGASDLIDAELQFDAYAENQIAAHTLARAVRDLLKGYNGSLPEGTTIVFTEITADRDAGYEVGAEGYVFRSLLRMRAMYTEAP